MRLGRFLLVAALSVSASYGAAACAVPAPPRQVFVPPPPFDASPYPGSFYFGSDNLWTVLPENGTWGTQHDRPTYDRRKIAWFSKNFSRPGQEVNLKVEARKLDGGDTLIHPSRATNGFLPERQEAFMLSSIEFPSTGCWEISAHYGASGLRFVVWVTPYITRSNSSSASLKK